MSGGLTALLLPAEAVLGLESRCRAESVRFYIFIRHQLWLGWWGKDFCSPWPCWWHKGRLPLGTADTRRGWEWGDHLCSPFWYHTPGKASPRIFFIMTEGTKQVWWSLRPVKAPPWRTHPNKADLDRSKWQQGVWPDDKSTQGLNKVC